MSRFCYESRGPDMQPSHSVKHVVRKGQEQTRGILGASSPPKSLLSERLCLLLSAAERRWPQPGSLPLPTSALGGPALATASKVCTYGRLGSYKVTETFLRKKLSPCDVVQAWPQAGIAQVWAKWFCLTCASALLKDVYTAGVSFFVSRSSQHVTTV